MSNGTETVFSMIWRMQVTDTHFEMLVLFLITLRIYESKLLRIPTFVICQKADYLLAPFWLLEVV